MSKTPLDLKGKKFNKLTVLYRDPENHVNKNIYWYCQCDCGKLIEKPIKACDISKGHTKSCGCTRKKWLLDYNTTHNLTYNRFYRNWHSIKQRCTNSNNRLWHRYGGRGIRLCDEWFDNPKAFIEYVSNLPGADNPTLTIDRIDNNGDYEIGNIRWLSRKEQGRNTSFCKINMEIAKEIRATYKKEGLTPKELQVRFNLSKGIIYGVLSNRSWKEYE